MSYDRKTLDSLEAYTNNRDRVGYYKALLALGDPYGAMALGVVAQSNLAGILSRRYAFSVSRQCCRAMNENIWLDISYQLMSADITARANSRSFEPGTPSLLWSVIRDYHADVFERQSLPPFTWTAWIPLLLDGPAKDQKLWHRMLTEDFIVIGVQVAWLALGRILHREGIKPRTASQVTSQLQISPPLVTGAAPDPKVAACMERLSPYLRPKASATSNERLAIFYLSVLAEDPNSYWEMTEGAFAASLGAMSAIPLPPINYPQIGGAPL